MLRMFRVLVCRKNILLMYVTAVASSLALGNTFAGNGCEQMINAVCNHAWNHGDDASCRACVDANIAKLLPACQNLLFAESKCDKRYPGSPTPSPTPSGGGGNGCQKRMEQVCAAAWNHGNVSSCYACAKANLAMLEPNCTLDRADKKCDLHFPPTPPPTPPTPAPPTPVPTPPDPQAPKPNIIVFVVDDQGYANVGYHNPENVHTPHTDALATGGLRLERHYTYRWCAPTRSALMTGRLPYHVFQHTDHVERNMNMLPAKLKEAGYRTHQVGKWHLGLVKPWMTPHGRGFDTSLGYLAGGEDHYTQFQNRAKVFGCVGTDLYETDRPALGKNGTYAAYIYNTEIARVINGHDAADKAHPLFMYIATQVMHAPQEVPDRWKNMYDAGKYSDDYRIMNGMASASDEVLANTTALLKAKGMWENTLLVYTSDNGGPAGQASSGHSGNNFPLRGGKTNNFEGGVRVVSFVSGGFLPDSVRNSTRDGYIHAADWYPTLCSLAGVNASDGGPSWPEIDGKDMWPYLTGKVTSSPRTEIMLSSDDTGALISGDFKLIIGIQSYGFWTSPNYPNASTDHRSEKTVDCGSGCVFNIREDPSEYHDLAKTNPSKLAELQALFAKLNATTYEAQKAGQDADACEAYTRANGGFLGPYMCDV